MRQQTEGGERVQGDKSVQGDGRSKTLAGACLAWRMVMLQLGAVTRSREAAALDKVSIDSLLSKRRLGEHPGAFTRRQLVRA